MDFGTEMGEGVNRNRKTWLLHGCIAWAMVIALGSAALPSDRVLAADVQRGTAVQRAPIVPPPIPTKPLDKPPKGMPDRTALIRDAAPTMQANTAATVDMKVLVIATDGTEADLPAITETLDYIGTPYTVYKAALSPGGLTPDKLADPANATRGYYSGVILTNGDLGYANNGVWTIALTATEWKVLSDYQVAFGVRRISWYTYPQPAYGFNWPSGAVDTSATPIAASFTTAGTTIFGKFVNTANPLTIQYAYTYLATALANTTTSVTTPVLTDGAGNVLAAINTVNDAAGYPQFDTLALTFDSNQYLTHNLTLAYGLINWVTNGIFLGERRAYIAPQPDDIFNENNMWLPDTPCGTSVDATTATFRINANDWNRYLAWQQQTQRKAQTSKFGTEMPINAVGTTADFIANEGNPAGMYSPDTLTPAAQATQGQFSWISHTFTHANLDTVTYATAKSELQQNIQAANSLNLTRYNRTAMVTPDVSGLTNPEFLRAAYDVGIRYLVSNTSVAGYNNPSPNAGITNPLQPAILMVPRHPTNLYFNVSTPQEWLAEDNCLYPEGKYGHVDTYQQLLTRESNQLVQYLLRGDIDPLMFHQPNLRAYDGTRSLLSDLLDMTFAKYAMYSVLPIETLTQQKIGERMANRMQYNAAGVSAKMVGRTTIVLTAQQDATVPITGASTACTGCKNDPIGSQNVVWVPVKAGVPLTLTLRNPLPTPPPRLALTSISPTVGNTAGGTTVKLQGSGFVAGATVTFGTTPATVTKVTSTVITVTTPANPTPGAVAVSVTVGEQTVSLANAYTYSTTARRVEDTPSDPTVEPTPAPAPPPRAAPPAPSTASGGSGTPAPTPLPAPKGR